MTFKSYILNKTLFLLLLTIISLSLLNHTYAKFGDDVNNGGGIAEKNILYAYTNMSNYLKICLDSSTCNLSSFEKDVVIKIFKSLKNEYMTKDQIIFVSEKEHPGTFILNGEMKIAKTGDDIGDHIYINTDLLYTKNSNNFYDAINLAQSVSILIHEFGHHHISSYDYDNLCTKLDLLGNKISMLLNKYISSSKLLPFSNDIMVMVFNEKTKNSFPQILIYVFNEVIDASAEFKDVLRCPYLTLPWIGRDISINSKKKPLGTTFHNIYWEVKKSRKLTIIGHLYNFCDQRSTFLTNNKKYNAHISFMLEDNKSIDTMKNMRYKKGSLTIKQIYDPWWKFLRLPF